MKRIFAIFFLAVVVFLTAGYLFHSRQINASDEFVSYQVDLQKQNLRLYWKDDKGELFRTLGNLNAWITAKGQTLLFAMNAGMFKADNSPQGLFIENGKTLTPVDASSGSGNFYLKPNGVFYVTKDQKAVICTTEEFHDTGNVAYATQSGPMLLIDGRMHPAFQPGSMNVNIRNGVGLLPNGQVVFALSKKEVNLYDFADYFNKLGCRDALYLDGFVSRTYLPEKNWRQTDGNFGVLIGVTAK